MNITQVLLKIEGAGFHLEVDGPDIVVNPPGKLSSEQRQFIRDHKPEIIAALLESSPSGSDIAPSNDHQAGPHVAIEQLPERLVAAATRVCRELHGDPDESVQTMMEDLCWNDPKDWDALTAHFEGQLPPPPETALVRCSGCAHAEYRNHPSIAFCRAGVESGNPTGGWWATDSHLCTQHTPRAPAC